MGTGLVVSECIRAAEALAAEGISARVIDVMTIKPLDIETLAKAAKETGALVVAEEHLVDTGLGSRVAQLWPRQRLRRSNSSALRTAMPSLERRMG